MTIATPQSGYFLENSTRSPPNMGKTMRISGKWVTPGDESALSHLSHFNKPINFDSVSQYSGGFTNNMVTKVSISGNFTRMNINENEELN